MKIEAKVIADSLSPTGKRITTLQLCYPRFIHSELMTHRVFSRNAMSSRAVPVAKMVEQVRNDPAMPVHWGKNQPGMQAREALDPDSRAQVMELWRLAAQDAANFAEAMNRLGAHKQIVNRVLEPFQWMHTVVTATEWDNFFSLRCHPDAQPEMQALAYAMRDAMQASVPVQLGEGEWHLPYVSDIDALLFNTGFGEDMRKVSAARCARVSYLKHDGGSPSNTEDLELFDRLAGSAPIHASPLEHQAQTADADLRSRNFVGWLQFREAFEGGE